MPGGLTEIDSSDALGWGPTLAAMRRELPSAIALSLHVAPFDDRPRLLAWHGDSDLPLEALTAGYDAALRSGRVNLRYQPGAPERSQVNVALTVDRLAGEREIGRLRAELYELSGRHVDDQLRVLLRDGPRFLGWIGLLRAPEELRFTCEDAARLTRLVPGIRRSLRFALRAPQGTIEQRIGSALMTQGFCALFSEEGRLVEASRQAAAAPELARWALAAGEAIRCKDWERIGAIRISLQRPFYLVLRPSPAACAKAGDAGAPPALSPREREVACMAAHGLSVANIAARLAIAEPTAKTLLLRAYKRLGVHNRADLVHRLVSLGMLA